MVIVSNSTGAVEARAPKGLLTLVSEDDGVLTVAGCELNR